MAEDLPDYFKIDQEDGLDAEIDPVGPTKDVDFVHVPEDSQGLGWFDRRNVSLSSGVDLTQLDFYKSCPRPYDQDAMQIPTDHPIWAIAKVLESAAENLTVCIKCYWLTGCFAIDLLLHYSTDWDIWVIIDYVSDEDASKETKKSTVKALIKFLEHHKHFGSYTIFWQIKICVAQTLPAENRHCCTYGHSSMHKMQIIMDSNSVYSSYNLTGYAWCKN